MRIYRVERKFCTRREDVNVLNWSDKNCVNEWMQPGFAPQKEPRPSWNKEPRSPYGWVGCDNSEATILWMDIHGIEQGNFRHLQDSKGAFNRPPPGADKKLCASMLTHFNVETKEELPKRWHKEFYFGFETEGHFYKWFDDCDFDSLRNKGYYLAIYEVDDNSVLLGDSQVMFKRADAVQVDFILF